MPVIPSKTRNVMIAWRRKKYELKARSTLHFVSIISTEKEPSEAVVASKSPPQVSNGDMSLCQLGTLSSKSLALNNHD